MPCYSSSISENNGLAVITDRDHKIYSVGISTGGAAEIRMALDNPNRHIIATTLDSEGALFARKQVKEAGLSKQIEVKVEDVTKTLPYADACFDYIYARLVLHYLAKSDLHSALKELHRVLKKGGKIFTVVRSINCVEAKDNASILDIHTGLTTYCSNGTFYSRHFHSEDSIQHYLKSSGFIIKHVNVYDEQLYSDFQRSKISSQIDTLIEVLSEK